MAALDNDLGTVGVAPQAKLLNGKVLGDDGRGQMNWSAQAVDWAVEQGANVISMSLGAPGPFGDLEEAIKRAVNKGVIVICAAGNSRESNPPPQSSVEWPGRYEACVCVAAFDKNLNMGSFSSYGPEVDVAAPGVEVLSLYPGGQVAVLSGTSMATPYVAGVAALYVSACKKAGKTPSPAEFREIIKTKSETNNPKPNPNSGWGRIVADKFVGSVGTDITPGGEVTFTQPDFSAAGWEKMQKAGLDKITLGLKGAQPQTTPAKAPASGGPPTHATGKVPS